VFGRLEVISYRELVIGVEAGKMATPCGVRKWWFIISGLVTYSKNSRRFLNSNGLTWIKGKC
jgi:hypothetical protein